MKAVINQTLCLSGSAIRNAVGLVFILSVSSACTNKDIYQSIQHDAQLKCQQIPPQEYQDCMDQHSQSYESYKRSRDEIIGKND